MLGVDEYIVNLLATLVHLRIFTLLFSKNCPITEGHPFIMEVSDRVPHLEYVFMPHLKLYYKRVGQELVVCDKM